jgi:phospholipid transport system substrate-binding protein
MARLATTLILVLLTCAAAGAAETPGDALRQVFAQADQILTDPDTEDRPLERLLAIRRLVNEAFDFRGAAELASGEHWRARTAAEQEEFTWLFADLLERGFVWRMASRARLERGTRVRYLAEVVEGDAALVRTAMARRDGGELLLDYYLVDREGAWKVRDVAIDGVSLMANYRSQLDRVLGNATFPELLTQMRAKVGTVEPREPPAVAVGPPTVVETVEPVSIVDVRLPAPELRFAVFDPAVDTPPALTIVHVVSASPAVRERAPIDLAPPPVSTPAVEPPPAPITKAYWLQVMTAGTADEAGRLVSRLRDGKFSIGVERTLYHGRPAVNVRVGPFHDAEQAVLSLLDLQTRGHDPVLVAERE